MEFQTWTTTQQGEVQVNPQEFDAFLFSDWWLARYVPDVLRPAIFAKAIGRVTSHHFDYLAAEARLADIFFPQFKTLAASSERLRRRVQETSKRPCLRLRTPVDLDYFAPQNLPARENPVFTVGWCGRRPVDITDFKGYGTVLVPIIAQAAQDLPNIHFEVLDAVYSSPHFVGDMRTFYSQIDVLLSTSWLEGDPLPVLEAAACGVPVVATDAGIVPELLPVVDGARTGVCTARGDARERVEACLASIHEVAFMPGWSALSRAARQTMEERWGPGVVRAEVMAALQAAMA